MVSDENKWEPGEVIFEYAMIDVVALLWNDAINTLIMQKRLEENCICRDSKLIKVLALNDLKIKDIRNQMIVCANSYYKVVYNKDPKGDWGLRKICNDYCDALLQNKVAEFRSVYRPQSTEIPQILEKKGISPSQIIKKEKNNDSVSRSDNFVFKKDRKNSNPDLGVFERTKSKLVVDFKDAMSLLSKGFSESNTLILSFFVFSSIILILCASYYLLDPTQVAMDLAIVNWYLSFILLETNIIVYVIKDYSFFEKK